MDKMLVSIAQRACAGILGMLTIASCSSPNSGAEPFVENMLNSSVGKSFLASDWNKPFPAKRQETFNDGSRAEYEFHFANKCSFVVYVDIIADKISGWRYTSEPYLCKSIAAYGFGA